MADSDNDGTSSGAGSSNAASGAAGYGDSWGSGYSDSMGGALFSGQPLSQLGVMSFLGPGLFGLAPQVMNALGITGYNSGNPDNNSPAGSMSGRDMMMGVPGGGMTDLASAPAWMLENTRGNYGAQVPGWIDYLPLSQQPLNVQNAFHQWRGTTGQSAAPTTPTPTTPKPAPITTVPPPSTGSGGMNNGRPSWQSLFGPQIGAQIGNMSGGMGSGTMFGEMKSDQLPPNVDLSKVYATPNNMRVTTPGRPSNRVQPFPQRSAPQSYQPQYMQEAQGPLNSTNLMNNMLAQRLRRGDFTSSYGGFNPQTPEAQYNAGVDRLRTGGSFDPSTMYGIGDIAAKIGQRTGATNLPASNAIIAQRLRGIA